MAATIIESPPYSPDVVSASMPFIIRLSSDVYGTAGITQFRYVAKIMYRYQNGFPETELGKKFTIVSESPNIGRFDLSEVIKSAFDLSTIDAVFKEPLPQLTNPNSLESYVKWNIVVTLSEQYYDNGVFTENFATLNPVQYFCGRGWTDDPDNLWTYRNWNEYNGLTDFIPFSGLTPVMYPQPLDSHLWPDLSVERFMKIEMTDLFHDTPYKEWWISRQSVPQYEGVVYLPFFWDGISNVDHFTGYRIKIYTSDTYGSGETVRQHWYVAKNLEPCGFTEYLIMFQDRFYQWSFMPFTRRTIFGISAQSQYSRRTEESVPPGDFRYNTEGKLSIRLNSDWMTTAQNEFMKDMIISDQTYFIYPDGTMEAVVLETNSIELQTDESTKLVQYGLSFMKSKKEFTP